MRMAAISPGLRRLLDEHIKSSEDLPVVPSLVAQLREDHCSLHTHLLSLLRQLSISIDLWDSRIHTVSDALRRLTSDLRRSGGADEWKEIREVLEKEMPQLAGEVGRIQMAHQYIETALRLETSVGDLEDAALSYMGQNSGRTIAPSDLNAFDPTDFGHKHEKLEMSIKSLSVIEDILVDITKKRQGWDRLVAVVDARVEQIIGLVRPQALREYRAILLSCGWPPSLDILLEKERKDNLSNSLLSMHGGKGSEFSKCFLSMCALQQQRDRQKARIHESLSCQGGDFPFTSVLNETAFFFDDNLWVMEELVSPLVPKLEHHFSKWFLQPKFIFALVNKVTQEFVEAIDNVLQPLMDNARFVRYSAKEAWVSAMVKMLSIYLKGRIFPVLLENYETDVNNSDSMASWLNMVDLIIESDKQMQIIASSGIRPKNHISEFGQVPVLNLLVSIFHDNPEWLQIWAEIELRDVEEKLKSELEDVKAWKIGTMSEEESINKKDKFLLSTREDCKAPPIAGSIVATALAMIERGRAFSSISIRAEFIKSTACVLMNWFYQVLLQLYEEKKPFLMEMEEEPMERLVSAVNAARYCETIMQGWTEDVTLLEHASDGDILAPGKDIKSESFLFQDEMEKMIKLETDCLLEMVSSLLLKFDSCSRSYVQGMRHIESKDDVDKCPDEEHLNVSSEFVEALATLNEWFSFLRLNLNSKDFADLWRSVAGGLDHFIFNSVILINIRYCHPGITQFKVDMKALYSIFQPFCLRPEAFFPCISDSLKLLSITREDAELLMNHLSKGDEVRDLLKSHCMFHLTPKQAKKILGKIKARSRSGHDAVTQV